MIPDDVVEPKKIQCDGGKPQEIPGDGEMSHMIYTDNRGQSQVIPGIR